MPVKGNSEGSFQDKFQKVTEEDLARALGQLTMPHVGLPKITVDELRSSLMIGQSTAYEYVKSGRLPAHLYITVALEAFRLGDTSLVEIMLPSGYTLQPLTHGPIDGNLEDDECRTISNVDRARLAMEKGDIRGARKYLGEAKCDLATFEAEIEAQHGVRR